MYNGVEQLFALISRCRPIYKSVKAPTAFNPFPHRKSLPLPTIGKPQLDKAIAPLALLNRWRAQISHQKVAWVSFPVFKRRFTEINDSKILSLSAFHRCTAIDKPFITKRNCYDLNCMVFFPFCQRFSIQLITTFVCSGILSYTHFASGMISLIHP